MAATGSAFRTLLSCWLLVNVIATEDQELFLSQWGKKLSSPDSPQFQNQEFQPGFSDFQNAPQVRVSENNPVLPSHQGAVPALQALLQTPELEQHPGAAQAVQEILQTQNQPAPQTRASPAEQALLEALNTSPVLLQAPEPRSAADSQILGPVLQPGLQEKEPHLLLEVPEGPRIRYIAPPGTVYTDELVLSCVDSDIVPFPPLPEPLPPATFRSAASGDDNGGTDPEIVPRAVFAFSQARSEVANRGTFIKKKEEKPTPETLRATFNQPSEYNIGRKDESLVLIEILKQIADNTTINEFSVQKAHFGLYEVPAVGPPGAQEPVPECKKSLEEREKKDCTDSVYRQLDGTCNNKKNPFWGSKNEQYMRFLLPDYRDKVDAPRSTGITGEPLPNPRVISLILSNDMHRFEPRYTHMVMQWGQFVSHDITFKPDEMNENGTLECCPHSPLIGCFPIELPPFDILHKKNQHCMEFVRSQPLYRPDCKPGLRENFNQVTPVIDASTVYGTDKAENKRLRETTHGKEYLLRTSDPTIENTQKQKLPALDPSENVDCVHEPCFLTGDKLRANQQPLLASFHTVWMREHNRLANLLAHHNPHWDSEKIFQEARRIVIAEIQHITYNEYLPAILGPEFMCRFGLDLQHSGYFGGYDEHVKPIISSVFSAAAYRFGHSLIQHSLPRVNSSYHLLGIGRQEKDLGITSELLGDLFNNVQIPRDLPGGLESLLLASVDQHALPMDEQLTYQVTERLYNTPCGSSSLDLFAINTHRGRDNGIPSYNHWREYCGMRPLVDWNDLHGVVKEEVIPKLISLYKHVEDLDLFPAGLSEIPVLGSVIGPTFSCIIAQQFRQLRLGDRFWYENSPKVNQPAAFSPDQLQEVRKVRLSRVLCDNMDPETIIDIQVAAMLTTTFQNPRVRCADILLLPQLDISRWDEHHVVVAEPPILTSIVRKFIQPQPVVIAQPIPVLQAEPLPILQAQPLPFPESQPIHGPNSEPQATPQFSAESPVQRD